MPSKLSVKKNSTQNTAHLHDLAAIAEESSDLIFITSTKGIISWISTGIEKIYGLRKNELLGKHFTEFLKISKAQASKVNEVNTVIKKGTTNKTTILLQNKKGTLRWNELKIKAEKNTKGKLQKFIAVVKDINEQVEKNEELLYSELRWKFAMEESGDGFFEYDLKNEKFYGSENLLDIFSLKQKDHQLDFQALINALHPDDSESAVNAMFDLIEGTTEQFRHELRLKNKAGNYTWTIVRATISSRNSEGKPLALIGTTTDISQIKQTEEELVKAKSEAEKASGYKDQFLSTMSHEIRTPLNAIIGMTDLMLRENPPQKFKENLDILSFSANHLLSLINDVLDLSKIEAGKIDFVNTGFNVEETVKKIFLTLELKCREKEIDFTYTIDKSIPAIITGDAMRLTQILNNLVSNAIKFTHKGSVQIKVSKVKSHAQKINLLFEVIDTGIGIDKKAEEKIFEDFVQASASTSHLYGGTGLGLAITKKLVELQGGKIGLESHPGSGSRFYASLDFGTTGGTVKTKSKASKGNQEQTTLKGIKVLLAEDILANQKVAVSYLNHWQAEVICANNGLEALKLLAKEHFDLLLIDLYMPVLNGFDAIKKIRKTKSGSKLPIIALTASIEPVVIKKALASGANVCLGKPFEASELLKTIEKLSGKKVAQARSIENKHKSSLVETEFKYISLKKIQDASLGKDSFIKNMIQILQQEIPQNLEACSNQLEKLNYQEFSAGIHKLKNGLIMLGLNSLKKDLSTLETNAREQKQLQKLPKIFGGVKAICNKAIEELNSISVK